MRWFISLIGYLLVAAPLCGAAFGQDPNPAGTWSWQTQTPDGPAAHTVLIRADGYFVRVDRLPNGTMLRAWGLYRGQQVAQNQFSFETQTQGYAPRTSCVAIQGMGQNCQPSPQPPDVSVVFVMTSSTTMQTDDATMFRDQTDGLLQAAIPDPSVIMGRAPIQPNIPQPVMPQPGYQTPYDPRQQYEQANQDFLHLRMRDCSKYRGQYYACAQ